MASIIIVSWQGKRYLDACLGSVFGLRGAAFEVIVVDNGSTDGSADFVAQHYPQAQLMRLSRNLGFAAGNNAGLRAATGDLLILLNQDTVVRPEWLAALQTCAATQAGPCIIGSKILYPDGSLQHAGGYLDRPSGLARHYGYRDQAGNHGQWDKPREVEFVTGAALGITRSAYDLIGGLDENLSMAYYEDIDWCLRARAAGVAVLYEPQAVLVHHESTSLTAGSYRQELYYHRGRVGCVLKHWPPDQLDGFVEGEIAHCSGMINNDDAITRACAYLTSISGLHRIQRKRERVYAAQPDMRITDRAWDGIAEGLLLARETALQRAGQATLPAIALPTDGDVQKLESISALQELEFTSTLPIIGGLIAAFRKAWYGVAARWAVHYVVHQQRQFNEQVVLMLRSMYKVKQALIQDDNTLAEQIRRIEGSRDHFSRDEET